jgi:arylsulfatase A
MISASPNPRARTWLIPVLILLPFWLSCRSVPAALKPNIVMILADDLGWADASCYGADLIETPHIDRLAREGERFTQAYAPAPVCSPTRASLLTGKYPARLGMTTWHESALNPPRNQKLLPAKSEPNLSHLEITLAARLQADGYLTALVGKWHLGNADYAPETHGFDVSIGGTHWGAPQTYWWPYRGRGRFGDEFRYVPHLEFGKPGEYLTDRLTTEALRVIDHAEGKPFFLLLAHHAPHTPLEAKPADIAYFESKRKPAFHHQNAGYAAMIRVLDASVGRVVEHLRMRGLSTNTVVVFASDNGGFLGTDRKSGYAVPTTSNAPLRSGKGSCYEGGLRVPMIIRWPGVTRPGTECEEPVLVTDLFATLLASAGLANTNAARDGVDLAPLLRDPKGHLDREALFFHYPHYYDTTTPVSAVRVGDWKLLEYAEDGHIELYRLTDDLGEQNDLSAKEPARAALLREKLRVWKQSVGAREPTPNPEFKPNPGR